MKLSAERDQLTHLSEVELRSAIIERRTVIRTHRDQKGDDRCWVDDWFVWEMLDDTPADPVTPPPFTEAMRLCREFWTHRNATTVDPVPSDVNTKSSEWDTDLSSLSASALVDKLVRLQDAIKTHRDITNRSRTTDDDRQLYAVLPEKIPTDFRLPPEDEFLGEARAPKAGCPSFWRSHEGCATDCHNLHAWGPCNNHEDR